MQHYTSLRLGNDLHGCVQAGGTAKETGDGVAIWTKVVHRDGLRAPGLLI
jgi:hypothetical protein